MFGHTDALVPVSMRTMIKTKKSHFLNDIGAKLLDRKRTNVACEVPNNGIAKMIVVKIQDILDNLVTPMTVRYDNA
jgi:hypothetical protein